MARHKEVFKQSLCIYVCTGIPVIGDLKHQDAKARREREGREKSGTMTQLCWNSDQWIQTPNRKLQMDISFTNKNEEYH